MAGARGEHVGRGHNVSKSLHLQKYRMGMRILEVSGSQHEGEPEFGVKWEL